MLKNSCGETCVRQQEKVIIWPAYFDSAKSRSEGRKVHKSFAVPSPRISEIKEAADKLGLPNEVVADAGYSKTPWVKTGMLLVKKKGSKNQLINTLAKQLSRIRSVSSTPKQSV
jgi:signal recognition particle subunit SRP19